MKINIAIDGPSAAGKSTIAKKLATMLGYVHLDTGAMYRCTAYKALQNGISLDDESALADMLKNTDIRLTPEGKVYLDGADVSADIRKDEVSLAASSVSRHAAVRSELVARQQYMAKSKGFIMDGRDIGTVVLKDAELKIFMTASVEARALRRYRQNKESGLLDNDLETIKQEIAKRDEQDIHRVHSPLRKADDAVLLDTSDLSIEETVEKIRVLAEPYLKQEETL